MMDDIIKKTFGLNDIRADEYSSLVLAYIGDCAYEMVIRTLLIHKGNTAVEKISKHANSLAKAVAQSKIILEIFDDLSEQEQTVYKRGRNAKSNTSAKNASINDYRRATGFEALIGWLYINGEYERMMELIKKGFEAIAAKSPDDPEATPESRTACLVTKKEV